ncbi:hypothetical protein [Paenibacillus sacheonensis]|uniref:Uncharacterized protein n=1 Tax=Paenibacillus sacheonensis TaxID=742054 RepID=A0A7X5C013_9BACL|nr:hypothetical protein [Paenibacillus sacheonensis]MBM7565910.1 hypothetical protein [Paenibacillus sacheonensis]NBC68775.1 hypothetical protein [Paenibacillus sacheonensis]
MAKSAARKRIEQRLRQGGMDPRQQRGNWNGVKPVTRVKPDKRKYAYPKNDDDRGFKPARAV